MYDGICYSKNYIEEVICRLDLATTIDSIESSIPKDVYNVIRKYYPIAEPKELIGAQLQLSNDGVRSQVNNIVSKQWVFWSRDRKSNCTIEKKCIVFSNRKYDVFDSFRKPVIDIMKMVMNLENGYQGVRLGLRYINMLPLDGKSKWINKKYFNPNAIVKKDKTIRILNQIEYAIQEKDIRVNMRYGYPNPDYPAVMKKNDFTIDIDAFSQGLIYCDDIEQMIDDMHLEIQRDFEDIITDDFRKILNKED